MPLLLTTDEVRSILTMKDCLEALESGYKQEGLGTAAYRTKATIYMNLHPDQTALFVTSVGGVRNPPVFAINIRSHVPQMPFTQGVFTTMLFSGETGDLLAIVGNQDIAALRTGGSAGLAAREMARQDAKVVGILGSGDTASAHALAYAAVRKIELFKVYSPNPEHRTALANSLAEQTGAQAEAFDNPEPVVRGSDIVASCTNSREMLIRAKWLDQPGVHMTAVQLGAQGNELETEALKRFHRLVTNLSTGPSTDHFTDPHKKSAWYTGTNEAFLAKFEVIPHHHQLVDVLLGKAPGRESDEERNYFFCEGTGIQYAAMAALAYDLAQERGIGTEMPAEVHKAFLHSQALHQV